MSKKNNEVHNTVQSSETGVVVQAGNITGDVGTIVQGGNGPVYLGAENIIIEHTRTVSEPSSGVVINGANYAPISNNFK